MVLKFWVNVKFWRKGQLIRFWKEKAISSVEGCMSLKLLLLKFFSLSHTLTIRNQEEVLAIILQGKKDLVLASHHQRIWWIYQRLPFACLCKNKKGKGKTEELWIKYVQLINVYLEYSRHLCEGALHDYISWLPKFTKI